MDQDEKYQNKEDDEAENEEPKQAERDPVTSTTPERQEKTFVIETVQGNGTGVFLEEPPGDPPGPGTKESGESGEPVPPADDAYHGEPTPTGENDETVPVPLSEEAVPADGAYHGEPTSTGENDETVPVPLSEEAVPVDETDKLGTVNDDTDPTTDKGEEPNNQPVPNDGEDAPLNEEPSSVDGPA